MIIGLVGLKQSGKSTAVEAIKSISNAEEIQLAKYLKDVCSEVFQIPRDHLDNQNYKEIPLSKPITITLTHLIKILDRYDLLSEDNLALVLKHKDKVITTPRFAAQYVGTDILRSIDPDIHIKIAVKKMDPTKTGIVSDIRFHNEFDAFKTTSEFRSIFILRSSVVPLDLASQHASEKDILTIGERCEVTIYNNGGVEEFQKSLKIALSGMSEFKVCPLLEAIKNR